MIAINKLNKGISLLIGIVLMTAAGLNWHWGPAAWLSPVFTLFFVRNSKKTAIILLFIGAIIAGGISRTCMVVDDSSLAIFISNGLTYAIPFIFPFIIDKWLYVKREKFLYTLIFPSSVVILEYLISLVIGTWGLTAHTMGLHNPMAWSVSIFGLFGLTFIIVWFGPIINWLVEYNDKKKVMSAGPIAYLSLLLFLFVFGFARNNKAEKEKIKVAAISSNTDILEVLENEKSIFQDLARDPKTVIPQRLFSSNTEIQLILSDTKRALQNKAKIIGWNEYVLILDTGQQDSVVQTVCSLAREYKAYILISFFGQALPGQKKAFNNKSLFISPKGEIEWEYLKSALHPTGEKPFINEGNFIMPYTDTEFGRIGSLICYDMDILALSRQARKLNIDIMILPSFDWEQIIPIHAEMAALEAIQNGYVLIRPEGSGYSQIYDCYGNSYTEAKEGYRDSNIHYADISPRSGDTIYLLTGNIFLIISSIILLLGLLLKLRKIRSRRLSKKSLQTFAAP